MDINILLLGKTGQGKSATANSILCRKKFTTQSSTTSVTSNIQMGHTKFDEVVVTVVDTVGYADTQMKKNSYADTQMKKNNIKQENYQLTKRQIKDSLTLCPSGFHAIIYVMKISRITQVDKDAFDCITSVVGKENFKKFGVLLFTFGSNYVRENESLPFANWCQTNQPELQKFLQGCDNRVILFENKINANPYLQLYSLMHVIQAIMLIECSTYNLSRFDEASKDRRFFDVEAIKESVESNVGKVLEDINRKLNSTQGDEPQNVVKRVRVMITEIDQCIRNVVEQDQQSNILQNAIGSLEVCKIKLNTALNEAYRKIKAREDEENGKRLSSERKVDEEIMRKKIDAGKLEQEELMRHFKRKRRKRTNEECIKLVPGVASLALNIVALVIIALI